MCLIFQETLFQDQVLNHASLSKIQAEKMLVIKARQVAIYRAWRTIPTPWLNNSSTDKVYVEVYEKQNFSFVLTSIRNYMFEFSFLTTLDI